MVTETVSFLHKQIKSGKNVLVEGANAAMLDIDFGEFQSLFLRVRILFFWARFLSPSLRSKTASQKLKK